MKVNGSSSVMSPVFFIHFSLIFLPANPHQKTPDQVQKARGQGQDLPAKQEHDHYVADGGECDPIVHQNQAHYLHTPGHKVEGVFVGDGAKFIAYSKAK